MTFLAPAATLLMGDVISQKNEATDYSFAEWQRRLCEAREGNKVARSELCAHLSRAAIRYAEQKQLPEFYFPEDFAQEIVSIFLKQYDKIENLPGWFATVCFRTRARFFRGYYSKHPESLDSLSSEVYSELQDHSFEKIALSSVEFENLLDGLNVVEQKIVLLRFVDGLSHGEIAKILLKTEGAVRTQFLRIKEKLRIFLSEIA